MIDNTVHHFRVGGVYNGMLFLRDEESGSYWDHMTGECFYGSLQGRQLAYVGAVQQMTAHQAAARDPHVALAVATPGMRGRFFTATLWRLLRRDKRPDGMLPPHFPKTMGDPDTRLDRTTLGLGVWDEPGARFYPLAAIQEAGGALLDANSGLHSRERALLLLIDPGTHCPAAYSVHASSIEWSDTVLRLFDAGTVTNTFHAGRFVDVAGNPVDVSMPRQLFTRWYGFSYTFPNCTIYGQE